MTSPVLLWGGIGSGKSGLVGALYDVGAGATAGNPKWGLIPGDTDNAEVAQYLQTMREGLLRRNTTPTSPGNYPKLGLIVRKRAGKDVHGQLELSFVDPAGELSENLDRLRRNGQGLLNEMLDAAGLIWLFDARQKGASHKVVHGQLAMLAEMLDVGYVPTPLALCISKVDLLDGDAREKVLNDPRAALRERLGEDVFDLFHRVFNVNECFAISSAGFEAGRIRPVGINEVFEWIYQQHQARRRARLQKRIVRRLALATAATTVLVIVGLQIQDFAAKRASDAAELARQREAVIDRAVEMFSIQESDSVVALLRNDDLPDDHPRAGEWNRMLVLAGRNVALQQSATGNRDEQLLRLVRDRTDGALSGLTSADAQAEVRYARAQVCMLLDCPKRQIRQDLEFVKTSASSAELRRDATKLAQEVETNL